jgi:hypothetical protein
MVPEYNTIKYFYSTDCIYQFDRGEEHNPNRYKDANYEFLYPVCGHTLKFKEWDDVREFINDITPNYIDFLNLLLESYHELIFKN